MRKVFFIFVAFIALLFVSCREQSLTVEKRSTPQTEQRLTYFYTVFDTIVDGQTVWGRAKHYYGDGQNWDSIVSQNPFLKEKGRISQDKNGDWYVFVKPNEVLKIAQKAEINVSIVDVGKIGPAAKPEKHKPDSKSVWFAVMLILFIIILFLIMTGLTRRMTNSILPKFSNDPASEGPAYTEDGISTKEDAEKHFIDLVQTEDQTILASMIIVKDVDDVYISTKHGKDIDVYFANDTKKKLMFRNEPGWKAQVSRNKGITFRTEAFFEACGNPINSKDSILEENLIFSKDKITFGDEPLSENIIPDEDITLNTDLIQKEMEKSIKEIEQSIDEERVAAKEVNPAIVQAIEIINAIKDQKFHKLSYTAEATKNGWKSKLEVETKNEKNKTNYSKVK